MQENLELNCQSTYVICEILLFTRNHNRIFRLSKHFEYSMLRMVFRREIYFFHPNSLQSYHHFWNGCCIAARFRLTLMALHFWRFCHCTLCLSHLKCRRGQFVGNVKIGKNSQLKHSDWAQKSRKSRNVMRKKCGSSFKYGFWHSTIIRRSAKTFSAVRRVACAFFQFK